MKLIWLLHVERALVALLLVLFVCFASGSVLIKPIHAKSLEDRAPDELIVKFRKVVSKDAQLRFLQQKGVKYLHEIRMIDANLVKVPETHSLAAWYEILKRSQLVNYVAYNEVVYVDRSSKSSLPNDTYVKKLWALNNTGQVGGTAGVDINAPQAWKLYTPKRTITVAVIDSGADYTHADLAPNIWVNSGEDLDKNGIITSKDINHRDDDGDGYADDFYGWNWVNYTGNVMDDNGHGTHVSGTIAARGNNRYGVVGIVGQGSVKIMPLKFLDRYGSGYTVDAIDALDFAMNHGALITNNSWGGGGYNQALYDAIRTYERAGGLFVAAAGNEAHNTDSRPTYPASYDLDNIISVASITASGRLSGFSNYGMTSVDLAAPGSGILSTIPHNRFASYSGTSMASPHVAGVAALLWTQNPDLSPEEVKAALMRSVTKNRFLNGHVQSGGYLNALSAIRTVGE